MELVVRFIRRFSVDRFIEVTKLAEKLYPNDEDGMIDFLNGYLEGALLSAGEG